jgi:hypothetical protein
MWLLDLRKQTALRGIFMIGRFGLILFTVLFLFGCVSSNKKNFDVTTIDKEKYSSFLLEFSKLKTPQEISTFLENPSNEKLFNDYRSSISKLSNQKEALDFLGEPSKKNIVALCHNPQTDKKSYELNEYWQWEKPVRANILFNNEGEINKKIQIPEFVNKEELINFFKAIKK